MMRITVLRSFRVAGAVHQVGASLEFQDALARELVANGKAAFAAAKPEPAAVMTTQSAAPIVAGVEAKKETLHVRK